MTTWTIKQAQRDFDSGAFKEALILFHNTHLIIDCCYTVAFDSIDGAYSGPLVDESGEPIQFKSMNAAHFAVSQIGFRTARITLAFSPAAITKSFLWSTCSPIAR